MKMEQTVCSETSAYKLQTPDNYPKERIQHTEHGESLKSRKRSFMWRPHASVYPRVSLYLRENRLSDFHEIRLRVLNNRMWSRCEFRENGCGHSRAVPTDISEF